MAITVTQRPSTTISGETSRWNAVGNPIVYKMTTDKYTEANYFLSVSVYDGSNNLLNTNPFYYTPDSAGNLTVDISAILRANLSPDFSGDLTGSTVVFTDSGTFIKFYIKYTELWTGSAEAEVNDSANQFFAVYGANQIPATYGGNLAEYVSFNDGTPKSHFITKLDSIRMWRGYPALVSAIVGDGVSGNTYFHADGQDSTPANLSGKLVALDLNQLLTTQTMDDVGLKLYLDDTPDKLLSETKTVLLNDACDGSIMLMARNKSGGILQWMFETSQEYTFDYGNDIKAARKKLYAENLTLNEWEALQDFITLGAVYRNNITELTSSTIKTTSRIGNQVYVIDATGSKTGVIVLPTRNTTNTKQLRHRFEIEIEYPEIFAV